MVCVPCFIVPVLLYLWHKFVQPILLKYWNPWEKKDKDGNVLPTDTTKFPFDCTGGVCRFAGKKTDDSAVEGKDSPVTLQSGLETGHEKSL
ncbi:AGAP000931-PA-like protein [Anopheles sinensis]|uniref:AGAP000931-PA-like protein n=1 Tax=Anopheles sinensis TaxID=74873 RepID=A0A084VUZ7_ANOSI|nr:AGAP000931-PA-like protein [Anopheles sinensis]